MNRKKCLMRLMTFSTAFLAVTMFSLGVHAEPDEVIDDISEQPVIQESVYDDEFSDDTEVSSEISNEISDDTEPSAEISDEISDDTELSDDNDVSDNTEISYPSDEPYDDDEPSETDENPFPWAQESTDYYYQPDYSDDEESYYYDYTESSQSPINPNSYYYTEESSFPHDSETTESSYLESDDESYYYEEEEEEEEESSGAVFHETSVDNSELTSRDWENLKNSFASEIKLNNSNTKSSDNAVRDIKDNNDLLNDNVNYLMWGLILIGMGLVIIAFVVSSTIYTKRKLNENSSPAPKKSGTKTQK